MRRMLRKSVGTRRRQFSPDIQIVIEDSVTVYNINCMVRIYVNDIDYFSGIDCA